MRRIALRWARLAAAVATALGGLALVTETGATAAVATSRFVPVTPTRVLDTRDGTGASGPVATGGTVTLALAGRAGIGAGATAVVLNVTATETTAAGYVTVWPSGTSRPLASNLNVERRGQTIANLVVVPLGSDGAVQLFAQTSMHLVADVAGWFEPATSAAGGRLVPATTPTRLVDTRNGTGAFGKVAAGGTVPVDVTGAVGPGYGAAVLNITATEATAPGFLTAWPSGTAIPTVSNLNVETAGQTIANLAIVPLGADGRVTVFMQNGGHLVVDLVAVLTDATAPVNGEGLFVPRSPTRVLDTRDGTGAPAAPVAAGGVVNVTVAGGGTALLNVTATNTRAAGYFTMWPAGQTMPVASSLNAARANQTIANLAISATGAGSAASIFSQTGADVVADLSGTFTAVAAITPVPPAVAQNPPPPASGRDRFHAIYAIPSDASLGAVPGSQPDLRPAALVPAIRSEIGHVRDWFASQSGNRKPRFVIGAEGIEVTVVNLPITTAALEGLGNGELDKVVELVTAAGALKPYEMGVIYLAAQGPACGETLDDSVLYMKDCGGIYPAADQLFPFGATYLAAHEMTHAFGAVDACAPHDDGTGHVTDSNADVLYQGNLGRDWNNLQLDPGHDDYYGHSIPGCQDIATHAAWLPAGAA